MTTTTLVVLLVIVVLLWVFVARMVRRAAGGGMRLLFLIALISLAAFVIAPIVDAALAKKAFGAEAKPWMACGSTVTWGVQPSPGTPETAKAAIGAAFAEIADVMDLTVMVQGDSAPGTATTVFAWDNPGSGVTYADGSVASDVNGMTGVTSRVHYFSQTGPNTGAALNTVLLKALTADADVRVQATGGHLTPADKVALKASCRAQASSGSSTPAPAAGPNVTAAPDGARVADVPATATTPAHPVTVTAREKLIGYGGAGIGGIVLAVTLFGGKLRNLATGRGIKVPRLRRPQWLRLPHRKPASD